MLLVQDHTLRTMDGDARCSCHLVDKAVTTLRREFRGLKVRSPANPDHEFLSVT